MPAAKNEWRVALLRRGKKHQSFLSFRSAGAAREPGIHEHRTMDILEMPVFMASGPAPAGRPGMTVFVSSEFLPSRRRSARLANCFQISPGSRDRRLENRPA